MADKIEGHLQIGTNGRREVVINLDRDRTGHIVFSPNQARQLARTLLKKANEAAGQLLRDEPATFQGTDDTMPPADEQAKRVLLFNNQLAVFSPYESHDADVQWTVQRVTPGDDENEMGEIIAEFATREDAELFAKFKVHAGVPASNSITRT